MITKVLNAQATHVYYNDKALDKSDKAVFDAAWNKFLEPDGGKIEELPVKPGMKVAEFDLVGLTRREYRSLSGLKGPDLHDETVAMGLRAVRNYRLSDGSTVALQLADMPDNRKRVTEASLNQIFKPDVFMHLAARILEISDLDP